MDWYILKHTSKTGQIMPEDLLILNEEGAVAIFTKCEDAYDFIYDNDLIDKAEVHSVVRE